MSTFLSIVIGICVLALYFWGGIAIIPMLDGDTSNEERKGCCLFFLLLIVFVVILYALRGCIS